MDGAVASLGNKHKISDVIMATQSYHVTKYRSFPFVLRFYRFYFHIPWFHPPCSIPLQMIPRDMFDDALKELQDEDRIVVTNRVIRLLHWNFPPNSWRHTFNLWRHTFISLISYDVVLYIYTNSVFLKLKVTDYLPRHLGHCVLHDGHAGWIQCLWLCFATF